MNISVFAPKPGSGASTIARMLALTLASKGPVLLVELDFYYPSAPFALGLYDEYRNLDRGLDDFNKTGAENWRLTDYVLPYRKTKMSVLAPYGKKGFEYFPRENPEFILALLHQAKQSGFEHVILDVPSLVDTVFCMESLSRSDLVLCVLNHTFSGALLYHHRMELFRNLNITTEVELVANCVHVRVRPEDVLKKGIPEKKPLAVIPYIPKLARAEKTGDILMPARVRKAMEVLIRQLMNKKTDKPIGGVERWVCLLC